MAAPTGHDRSRKAVEDDDEIDPFEAMLKKSGCAELHYAVQDCMAEHQDWRKCQKEVAEFRACIEKNQKKNQKS